MELYLTLHCRRQNGSAITRAAVKAILNVSLIVGEQSHKLRTTTFEERGEPKRNRTEVLLLTSLTPNYALPLVQTGSR